MKKIITVFALVSVSFLSSLFSNENPLQEMPQKCLAVQEKELLEKTITFHPPSGWKMADLEKLPPAVKALAIGESKGHFPPSMSLAVEPFEGSLKDYLKIVKNINLKDKTKWKDLGKIDTKAGTGSLSQYDENSNWGITRTMTTILVRDGNAYILSATALQTEFSNFYKDFFSAMRSLDLANAQAK